MSDAEQEKRETMKRRVETAAVAIFAGIQANPNWVGSLTEQWSCVNAAKRLIEEIDNQMGSSD